MRPVFSVDLPRWVLQTLNHVCEIERKVAQSDPSNIRRNVERIKEAFESEKLFYEDPLGQAFEETRTDLEVSIAGARTDDLVVVEVIKPIVRYGDRAYSRVIQKGVVIVSSRAAEEVQNGGDDQLRN